MVDTIIKKTHSHSLVPAADRRKKMTIVDLVALIVEDADRAALDELLNRSICTINGERLNVVSYLLFLKDSRKPEQYESVMTIEEAYNLALSKFCSFPKSDNNSIDCRRYYQVYLRYTLPLIFGKNIIDQEIIAARTLKNFLSRQFRWSLCDAARKGQGFSRPYLWNIGAGYRLHMPSVMTGRQCKKWLQENIGRPDTQNSYEQQRIQQIIDERLFVPSVISLGTDCFDDFTAKTATPLGQLIEAETESKPLSVCIAEEKADNLDSIRNSIARIGRDKVRKLVIAIFDAVIIDNYKPSVLGAMFGVNPAAMTRFASLKFDTNNGNNLPQLWRNVARYVVNLPQYSKILYETGLYDKLSSMALED